jgi:hypothetical protein
MQVAVPPARAKRAPVGMNPALMTAWARDLITREALVRGTAVLVWEPTLNTPAVSGERTATGVTTPVAVVVADGGGAHGTKRKRAHDAGSADIPEGRINFRNWECIVKRLSEKCPKLTHKTSKEEWKRALASAKQPAFAKVTMVNADGTPRTSTIGAFLSGNTKNLTKSERASIDLARSIKGDTSCNMREDDAIEGLRMMVAQHGMTLQNMDALGEEHTSSDAFFALEGDLFVGVQVTRINPVNFSGCATINKSSLDFENMLGLGFAFVAAIYSEGIFCGAYLWLPCDEAVIADFEPPFTDIKPSPFSKYKPRKGSLVECMKPFLYMWRKTRTSVDETIKEAFIKRLLTFVRNETTTKYTFEDLAVHLQADKMKERLYTKQLISLIDDPVVYKRVTLKKGDGLLIWKDDGFEVLGENKLACRHRNQFHINFRMSGREPWDLNEVDFMCLVVTVSDDVNKIDKTTKLSTYKFFILIPTRTVDGMPNIRFDDPLALAFTFYFDRKTLKLRTNGFLKDEKSVVVLVAGEGSNGRRFDAAAQVEVRAWAARKHVDMEPIVKRWYAERRDKEQAVLVKSNKRKRDLLEAKLRASANCSRQTV